jgi:two-component system sensor histidine kinase KdpD
MRATLLSEIHTAGERLNRLVGNLLDMTRLESGLLQPRMDWCDIRDVVGHAVADVRPQLTSHTVVVEIPNDFPLVKLDFGLIERVLVNLLLNASVYTPPGSVVTISATADENGLTVTVTDNGPGFPRDSLPRVFEKFYRVPGTGAGGSGLGLSIARGFVEAHKGTLAVENCREGGARFIMSIPAETKHIEADAEPGP